MSYASSRACLRAVMLPLLATVACFTGVFAQQPTPLVQYSSFHRQTERPLLQTATATDKKLKQKLALGRTGVSLVAADFDSDGSSDLISGYAVGADGVLLLQRGSALAIAPGPQEQAAIAAGQIIMPYVEKAEAIDIPVRPDLLTTADLHGHGHFDLLVAAKGDRTVYVLAGDGHGGFGKLTPYPLAGAVSSLATWRGRDGKNVVLAGVCGGSGCGLQALDAEGKTLAFLKTHGAVAVIQPAQLNLGAEDDLVLTTAGSVQVLDGKSFLSKDAAPHLDAIAVSNPAAVATGLFAYDRRGFKQLAVLGADATLHVFARSGGVDTSFPAHRVRPTPGSLPVFTTLTGMGWDEVETVPNVGPGGTAIMLRGRFSGTGGDDLAVLANGQYVTVAHPMISTATVRKSTPVVTVDSQSSPAVSAIATRISDDARVGVVSVTAATLHPLVLTPPSPTKTINVNTTQDLPASTANIAACNNNAPGCSLRAAVGVVNNDSATNGLGTSKIDKIVLPAGTFTLSLSNNSPGSSNGKDANGSIDMHLDVDGAVNIVGASQTGTILQAGTIGYGGPPSVAGGNGVDSLIEENSYIYNTQGGAYDMFLSNLTLQNGNNPNQLTSANNYYENAYGGALDFDVFGSAVLTVTNVTFQGNYILNGSGGAVTVFNTNQGTVGPLEGGVDFENSLVTTNYSGASGGGIFVTDHIPLTVNSTTITNNSATLGNNTLASTTANSGSGGGGIFLQPPDINVALNMSNSTVSNNTSDGFGGGINLDGGANISNSTISGNKGPGFGAGLYINPQSSAVNLTELTVTNNAISSAATRTQNGSASAGAPNGGGICSYPNQPSQTAATFNLTYSRFHGNTGGTATGFYDGCGNTTGIANTTVNLANNWWGCNGPGAGTGCDTAVVQSSAYESLTLTPYTTLILNLSSTTPAAGSIFTATGSLGQNSSGTKYTTAQDYAYNLTPATMAVSNTGTQSISGSTFSATANTSVSNAAITDSSTPGNTGQGLATVTVDGCTIKDQGSNPTCNSATTYNYTVIAPDLTVTSAHTGNFKAGDTGDTYTLTVANTGNAPTTGTVNLSDTLPTGFTATAISGTGWTCTQPAGPCNRSDQLSSSVTYPPVTVTVNVASTNAGTYTNTAVVSGGGKQMPTTTTARTVPSSSASPPSRRPLIHRPSHPTPPLWSLLR